MRRSAAAVALALAILAGGMGMSEAMGRGAEVTQVACTTEGGKTRLPDGLCAAFIARLRAARPELRLQEGEPADLRLVVEASTPQSFAARIDQGSLRGAPLATARRGAPLDSAARAALLDDLIARMTP